MAHWLKDAPTWLEPLRRDLDAASDVQLEWLGAADAMADAEALAAVWEPDRFFGAFGERCHERVARSTPVAALPDSGAESEPMILFDPLAPEGLWLSLDMNMPPLLWIPLGCTVDSVRAVFRPASGDLSRIARGYVGRADALGIEGIADLEDRVVMEIPWLEGPRWGVFTLASDDPFTTAPRRVENHGSVADVGGLAFTSAYVAAASRSRLTFEAHPYDAFLADIRYAPAPHAAIVAEVAAVSGIDFPRDLPLDVIAALITAGGFVPHDALREGASPSTPAPGLRAQALLGLTAVAPRAPDTAEALRAALREPDLEEVVAALALAYGLDDIADELAAVTERPDLREWLQQPSEE